MYRCVARPETFFATRRGVSAVAPMLLPSDVAGGLRRAGTSSAQHTDALKQRRHTTIDGAPATSPAPAVARTPHARVLVTPAPNPAAAPSRPSPPRTAGELKASMGRTVGGAATGDNTRTDSRSQLEEVEHMMAMAQMYPHADIWGQKIGTLNVVIPEPVLEGASLLQRAKAFKSNFSNWTSNAASLYRLADTNSFPDVSLNRGDRWSRELFRVGSTDNDAWVAGIRSKALDTYEAVNQAIARGDDKMLKKLATASYLDHATKLARQYDRPDRVYRWKMLNINSPAQILSIRAVDGYLGTSEPKLGSRLLVHALIKFDTQQSFETLAKKGGARIFETNKRVVEHLVFERRMWYDGPWVIRDQLFS